MIGVMITYNFPAYIYIKCIKPPEDVEKRVWGFFYLGIGMMFVGTIGSFYTLFDDMVAQLITISDNRCLLARSIFDI